MESRTRARIVRVALGVSILYAGTFFVFAMIHCLHEMLLRHLQIDMPMGMVNRIWFAVVVTASVLSPVAFLIVAAGFGFHVSDMIRNRSLARRAAVAALVLLLGNVVTVAGMCALWAFCYVTLVPQNWRPPGS